MNGYTYANNSPVTNADADGTMCYHTSNGLTDCYNNDGVIRSPNKGERGYTVYPNGVNRKGIRSGNSGGAPWAWSPPARKRPAPTVTCNGGLALHTGCSVGAPVPSYSDCKPGTTSTFEKIVGVAVVVAAICLFGGCELAAGAGRTATTFCMARIVTCIKVAGLAKGAGDVVNEGNGGQAGAPVGGRAAGVGSKLFGPGWVPYGSSKIPSGWSGPLPTKKFRKSPNKPGYVRRAPKGQDSVRIDKGDPNAYWDTQKVDHVVINSGGRIVGRGGELLPPGARIQDYPEAAHIPLEEWLTWRSWNAP